MRYAFFILLLLNWFILAQDTEYLDSENDQVVIFATKGNIFDQARNGLVNEIRDEFSVSVIEVTENTSTSSIDSVIDGYSLPKAVVLIGNNAVRSYVKYANQNRQKTESIQVVTILALDVQRAVAGIEKVNAIAYETPMLTALVSFRRVFSKPVNKVGVLYRNPLKEFIEKHTRYCAKENISIIGIEVSDDTSKIQLDIASALQNLIRTENVDALWIPNDNVLLKPEFLGNIWFPALKKKKIPLIVGVEALVNPELNFGTFAVIPDPVAMGEQAAEIIYNLKADDWQHNGIMIHPAISMYSVLNLKKAYEIAAKEDFKTYEVSKILKK
jgi:hypothetical protein